MEKKYSYLLQIHLSVFLFGFAGLFGKWIALDAMSIVWGRVLFASLAFLIWFAIKKTNPFLIPLKTYSYHLVLGILLAFHWWAFFHSIQLSTVAIGLFCYASFPVFTVLLEPVIFKRKIKLSTFFLLVLSSFGIYLILPEINWASNYTQGVLWGLLSGLSFALLTIGNKLMMDSERQMQTSLQMAFFQDFFALIFLSPFLFYIMPDINSTSWMQLIVLGVLFTAIGHFLFINGLKKTSAQAASFIANMEPVYGVILAFFLLGEKPAFEAIVGGGLILFSALLASLDRKSENS